MNDPGRMPSAGRDDDGDGPFDAVDAAILNQVRAMHDLSDPPPPDLNDRVRFAIRLEDADIEICRLLEDSLLTAGARTTGQARAITFEAPDLTIMATVTLLPSGHVQIDGWLAPAEPMRMVLRVADAADDSRGRPYEVRVGANGRFSFADVPAGLAQIMVYRSAADRPGLPTVVTPPVML